MEEKLADIIKKHIKPNEVVLVAEIEPDGLIHLETVISLNDANDVEVEKKAKLTAYALNGFTAYMASPKRQSELVSTGLAVVLQKMALDEAEKEG